MSDEEREFIDDAGVLWFVSEAYHPETGRFLSFTSVDESRALAPFPQDWHLVPRQDLRALLAQATPLWRRKR